MCNNLENNDNHLDLIPNQFLKYIDYELTHFEKLTGKKFFFNLFEKNIFQLNVYESKDDKREKQRHDYDQPNSGNMKSVYHMIYRTDNIYQFVKRLLIFREHLVKNSDNNTI